MRCIFSYSFLSFLARPVINLFMVFELFVVLVAVNFSLAQYNSRTMLYDPVRPYLERQGFMLIPSAPLRGDSASMTVNDLLKDADILSVKNYHSGDYTVTVLPDDVFDSLRLPVDDGRIFDRSADSRNMRVIVTRNGQGIGVGNTLELENGITLECTAVLTDPTYLMHISYSSEMSFEEMYRSIDSKYYGQSLFCYTSESELRRSDVPKETVTEEMYRIVSFRQELSENEYTGIQKSLQEQGYALIPNSEIVKNSEKILSDSFRSFIPAVIAFGVVVLTGIISCSFVSARSMLKKLAVFYCCGATKTKCVLISVGQNVIITLSAALASDAAIVIIGVSGIGNKFGFVLRSSNILISAAVVLGCLLVSAIAPAVLISRANPRELLTDTANG